jgi:hypothetical protein
MNRFPLQSVWTGLMLLCLSACVSSLQRAQKAAPATTAQTKAEPTQAVEPKQAPVKPAPIVEQTRAISPTPPADKLAAAEPASPVRSFARDAKEYRKDAAKHIYQKFPHKIYTGKLPPLLKAVAVLDVVIGPDGRVQEMIWSRPPSHVPEVMADIENMVRNAGPFPAPVHMRKVVYTETWLWHASNRFQLDTLTEGQK